MSREDAFMDMMEEEIIIAKLMGKISILKHLTHLTTKTVLLKDGDKFHSFYIHEVKTKLEFQDN